MEKKDRADNAACNICKANAEETCMDKAEIFKMAYRNADVNIRKEEYPMHVRAMKNIALRDKDSPVRDSITAAITLRNIASH